MSASQLITLGIGPGAAIKYVITGGLDVGEAVETPAFTGGGPGFAFAHGPRAHRNRAEIREEIEALLAERRDIREEIAEERAEVRVETVRPEPSPVPALLARLSAIETELRALRARQAAIEDEEETLALLLVA